MGQMPVKKKQTKRERGEKRTYQWFLNADGCGGEHGWVAQLMTQHVYK